MAELGEALRLEKSSLSGLIDRAEARELVTRVRDSNDRRACQVSLTASGSDLHGRFHDYVSSELNAPDLERKLVQRVLLFDFGAKDVEEVTTTKPIDFFPA